MKKLMYFAAALLVLVGCNKNEQENKENAPQNLVTITGGIDFPSQVGARKVAARDGWEDVAVGGDVEFVWEAGDEIAVCSRDDDGNIIELKKFTASKILDEGAMAEFIGESLSGGMRSYFVFYPYGLGEACKARNIDEWFKHQQYTGKFNPACMGVGFNTENTNEFVCSAFYPVFDLSLTGEVALGKIELYLASSAGSYETECCAAISMGEEGLQLTSTPQHIAFPILDSKNEGFKLKFYDTDNQWIVDKEISKKDLVFYQILSFPVLEVKYANWTKALQLGKETVVEIIIETGVDVSDYTEDENHKKLDEDGLLWEYLDNSYDLHIQTSVGKINTSLEGLFSGYVNMESITGLQYIHATTAEGMFQNCSALKSHDYTGLNTADVTNMRNMFFGCGQLQSINLSSFNTAKVTDMSSMFSGCTDLFSLDLSGFNTANVTDMSNMFFNCGNHLKNLDLSSFNTTKVTDMSNMFSGCGHLTSLKLSANFKVAETKTDMFSNCGDEDDGCSVRGVTDPDIMTALTTGTGWEDSRMHFAEE